jgi:cyclopropane fatty-acyl-phospholipid synthase-like methyltransferase
MKKTTSYLDLYIFSIKLGLNAIFKKGKITRESIKRILCPLDPSRYYELPRVANNLQLRNGSKILDISSAKLLVHYLARQNPEVDFYAIDKFREEIKAWEEITDKPRNLTLLVDDATKLNFKSKSFDEVFSISVVEHVDVKGQDGDSLMMKEVLRILKNKGRFVFTTVLGRKPGIIYSGREVYSEKRKRRKTFFSRIYDLKSLKRRVLSASALEVEKQEVCNYRFPFGVYEKIFNSLIPYSALVGFLNILVVPWMLSEVKLPARIKERAEYFAVLSKNSS